MKTIRLLKNYPELDLRLSFDDKKNTLIFSGNQTPTNLMNIDMSDDNEDNDFFAEEVINGRKIRYFSYYTPDLRLSPEDLRDGILKLFIGGIDKNEEFFREEETQSGSLLTPYEWESFISIFKSPVVPKYVKLL